MEKSGCDFCEKVFIPEREKIEIAFAKKHKYPYLTIKQLEAKKDPLAKILKDAYMKSCNEIYCQKTCKNKNKWLKSFSKTRKNKLIKKGALSGCRDLKREFPEHYKNSNI